MGWMGELGAFLGVSLFPDDLADVVEEGFPNFVGDRNRIVEMFEVVLYNFF